MEIYSDLAEPVELFKFSETSKVLLQDKLARGCEMIDIRVWTQWSTDKQYHPGKNGLFIEKEKLLQILPKLMVHFNLT